MEYMANRKGQIVSWNWCGRCGGEMVSCECEEVIDDEDGNYDPDAEDYVVVSDWQVDWKDNENGIGGSVVILDA
jgi:hypothetical protein